MSLRTLVGRLAVPLALVGCFVGPSAKNYAPARGPGGAIVALVLSGSRELQAELLAVEDSTLLVLRGRELVRVAVAAIESVKAPKVSFNRSTLRGDTRERLRLISRYPQGVAPELEARLLEAYGRSGVRAVS